MISAGVEEILRQAADQARTELEKKKKKMKSKNKSGGDGGTGEEPGEKEFNLLEEWEKMKTSDRNKWIESIR